MKKTDLYKNLGLSVANKMKNAAKVKGPGSGTKAKTKQQLADELVKANPLLAAFSGKPKSKPPNEAWSIPVLVDWWFKGIGGTSYCFAPLR